MQVMRACRNSFKLFLNSLIGLSILITLRSAKQLLREPFFSSFYIFSLLLFTSSFFYQGLVVNHIKIDSVEIFRAFLLGSLIFFTTLTMRASRMPKSNLYLLIYVKKFWLIFMATVCFCYSRLDLVSPLFLLYMFFIFLLLDADRIFYNFLYAFKSSLLIIYNNPMATIIMSILLFSIERLLYIIGLFTCIDFSVWYLIYIPIKVLIVQNFYLLILYEQSKYYFKEP